jgi:DNA helicase-2/ATP-dependent DNA helicase PcrA
VHIPLVYQEFERLRNEEEGVTFDDFVPIAVGILEHERAVGDRWRNRTDFVIVDEYQDVNYGQQRLIELLAGKKADVMVVGDDDQTIYEWRGARPNYILRELRAVFNNKPHQNYTLSHSFRFGPVLAQYAENVICFNANRIPKPLMAHSAARPAYLEVLIESSEQPTDVNKELAQQVVAMVRECGDPRKVIVLGRMFSQLSGLEAEFLARRIPYHVLGRAPFFERRELRVLLDYVRLAVILDQPVSKQAHERLQSIANTPNRKLSRETLSRAMEASRLSGATTRGALESLTSSWDSPLSRNQRARVNELLELLDRLQERVIEQVALRAGELLDWLVDVLNYLQHFDDYYGQGEASEDRKRAIQLFCGYAMATGLGVLDFLLHVEELDPTQGRPEEEQVRMTTVFRTKGLEYDYVVIPSCVEGYMPFLVGNGNLVYDKAGIVQEPVPSEIIENERRLFYVAITRARTGVLIGASAPPAMGSRGRSGASIPSRFLHEIQREPTVALMQPLQRLAAGQPAARAELRSAVAKHGNVKAVVQNLLAGYLPGLKEHTLAAELGSIAAQLPARPFGYPQTYATATIGVQVSRPGARSEPQWWDDDDY